MQISFHDIVESSTFSFLIKLYITFANHDKAAGAKSAAATFTGLITAPVCATSQPSAATFLIFRPGVRGISLNQQLHPRRITGRLQGTPTPGGNLEPPLTFGACLQTIEANQMNQKLPERV